MGHGHEMLGVDAALNIVSLADSASTIAISSRDILLLSVAVSLHPPFAVPGQR